MIEMSFLLVLACTDNTSIVIRIHGQILAGLQRCNAGTFKSSFLILSII